MFILDTDTLSLLHAGHERVGERKDRVDPTEVSITIITKIEVLRARYDFIFRATHGEQLLRAQQWLIRSQQLIDEFPLIVVTGAAATEFDRLRERKSLKKIGRADLLIASIALANRATLVTRNLRHFRQVPNLDLVNWAD